jgi:hypothetical protein
MVVLPGEQEQQAAEEVDGLDAERVGDQATEGEGGEPPGLSDHVESGEDWHGQSRADAQG